MNGGNLIVHPPSKRSGKRRYASTDIKLRVPAGATGDIRTASGDIAVLVELRSLVVATASGDLRSSYAIAEDLEVKTASGDVKVRDVGGNVFATTASGDGVMDDVHGDVRFNSASGDLRVGRVDGVIEIRTVSGDVSVDNMGGHTLRARTLSGSVRVGIPAGRTVDLDMQTLSGDVVNRLSKSGDSEDKRISLAISVKTVSGDLKLENA
jgi:DUF4097 and DUF4098 domain-containing protein YvlB